MFKRRLARQECITKNSTTKAIKPPSPPPIEPAIIAFLCDEADVATGVDAAGALAVDVC